MLWRASLILFIMSSVCDAIVSIYPFDAPYSDVKRKLNHKTLRRKRPYGWQLGLIDRCQVHKLDRGTVTMKIELFFHKLPHLLHTLPTDLQSWALNWLFWVSKEPCLTIVDVPGRVLFDSVQLPRDQCDFCSASASLVFEIVCVSSRKIFLRKSSNRRHSVLNLSIIKHEASKKDV
ncbi:hypothetical protein T265_12029 [Opisthorchis viverrini]|uniref:Secreted protein n=1 Tax=Opisthorchis viverrini TaxID=6198 RepID=A0A074Z0R7_OPIVI|nr:hypothetical protein T265_12029 [Opisthorchis viverrini]KER19062.1 hypothetical protein T265_12029 [Opisthorchis viverrini]